MAIRENLYIAETQTDFRATAEGHPLLRGLTHQSYGFTLTDGQELILGGSVKNAVFFIRVAGDAAEAAWYLTDADGNGTVILQDLGTALDFTAGAAANRTINVTQFYYNTTNGSLQLSNDDDAAAATRTFIITRLQ